MNAPRSANVEESAAAHLKLAKARLAQLVSDASLDDRQLTGLPPEVAGPLALSQLCSVCQTVGFLEGVTMADSHLAEQLLDEVDRFAELLDQLGELPAPLLPADRRDFNPTQAGHRRRHSPQVTADRRSGDRRQIADRRARSPRSVG